MSDDNMTEDKIKVILEFALLAAGQPLDIQMLKQVFKNEVSSEAIHKALSELEQDWEQRAFRLLKSASGFQFVSRPEYASYITRLHPSRPPRISRALVEILAVVVYHQPVTRGDIEKMRGVSCSSSQFAFLEEQKWVEEIGQRNTPGRPALYATTKIFLDDLGLTSLQELPSLEELHSEMESNFEVTQ